MFAKRNYDFTHPVLSSKADEKILEDTFYKQEEAKMDMDPFKNPANPVGGS